MQPADLDAFLDAGVAMIGASADADGVPEAFRVWGATLDGAGRVRALVSSNAVRTFESLRSGPRLSLVFTDVTTFTSVQVKGPVAAGAEPPGPAESALIERYERTFGDALAQIGHPPALLESLRPRSVFVVTVAIEELYDQTPGPRAGRPVEGVSRG
jgi:hypothetical protein